jgi:hypothetical protein
MKKVFITSMVVFLAIVSFAQKPEQGNLVTEANLNVATNAPNFTLPALRARYFLSNDLVLRADLSFNGTSMTENFYENADGTGKTGTSVMSTNGFGLGLGIEKHFAGNERFSPFVSFGLGFSSFGTKEEWDNSDGFSFVDGDVANVTGGLSAFGVNVGIGADYWIGKSFYLGAEFGLGFNSLNVKDQTTEYTPSGGTKTTTVQAGGAISSFGEFINGGIRIGFILF